MAKTPGELRFERYLARNGVPDFEFEKTHPGKAKRPDYTLPGDSRCVFDVKDNENRERPDGKFDPYPWLREQIEQGRRKFKEFKEFSCSIVMFAEDAWWFSFMAPEFVFGAMYGDYGMTFEQENGPTGPRLRNGRPAFLDNGKVIRPRWRKPQNTTISSLIMLRPIAVGCLRLRRLALESNDPDLIWDRTAQHKVNFAINETTEGVAVYENSFARVALPAHLFRGPFDERWGEDDDGKMRRNYVGDELALYESLLASA